MTTAERDHRALCASGGVRQRQGAGHDPASAAGLRLLSAAERAVTHRRSRPDGLPHAGARTTVRRVLTRRPGVAPAGIRSGTTPRPRCAAPRPGGPVAASLAPAPSELTRAGPARRQ
ncbi:hypothetical protein ACFUKV_07720 [Streptomyces paradoxus]|uniref:hypothetical protein n=1 Tax=Streptomyces paradoxus TaxID=66375 RepID=UPI00362DFAC3